MKGALYDTRINARGAAQPVSLVGGSKESGRTRLNREAFLLSHLTPVTFDQPSPHRTSCQSAHARVTPRPGRAINPSQCTHSRATQENLPTALSSNTDHNRERWLCGDHGDQQSRSKVQPR